MPGTIIDSYLECVCNYILLTQSILCRLYLIKFFLKLNPEVRRKDTYMSVGKSGFENL